MHRQLSRINETLYAESNTSVAKIWSNSVHVDTRFGLDSSGSVNRNVSASESTVTDQSRCNSDPRKRESIDASVERIGCHSKRLKMEESKEEISESKTDTEHSSGEGSKPIELKAQPTEPSIQNYIHVRARRGQATDSHSLAERARREKISERMKILQDLVPGCNKVIGKALVLDEIINYIQSLQHQVEFLSMKLEAVNSQMNNNVGLFPSKDFGVHTYDIDSMPFVSEAPRQYPQGSTPEWLHMGFDRPV